MKQRDVLVTRSQAEVDRLRQRIVALDATKAEVLGRLVYAERLLAHHKAAPVPSEVEEDTSVMEAVAVALAARVVVLEPAEARAAALGLVVEADDISWAPAGPAAVANAEPVTIASDAEPLGFAIEVDPELVEVMGEFKPTAVREVGRRKTVEERIAAHA